MPLLLETALTHNGDISTEAHQHFHDWRNASRYAELIDGHRWLTRLDIGSRCGHQRDVTREAVSFLGDVFASAPNPSSSSTGVRRLPTVFQEEPKPVEKPVEPLPAEEPPPKPVEEVVEEEDKFTTHGAPPFAEQCEKDGTTPPYPATGCYWKDGDEVAPLDNPGDAEDHAKRQESCDALGEDAEPSLFCGTTDKYQKLRDNFEKGREAAVHPSNKGAADSLVVEKRIEISGDISKSLQGIVNKLEQASGQLHIDGHKGRMATGLIGVRPVHGDQRTFDKDSIRMAASAHSNALSRERAGRPLNAPAPLGLEERHVAAIAAGGGRSRGMLFLGGLDATR